MPKDKTYEESETLPILGVGVWGHREQGKCFSFTVKYEMFIASDKIGCCLQKKVSAFANKICLHSFCLIYI